MQVEGVFYVNDPLEKIMFDELRQHAHHQGFGGFLPGMKQIANVAALPGIVGVGSLLEEFWCSNFNNSIIAECCSLLSQSNHN